MTPNHCRLAFFRHLVSLLVVPLAMAQEMPTELPVQLGAVSVQGGLIVQFPCSAGPPITSLLTSDRFIVHGLDSDPARVDEIRQRIRSTGDYGPVSVDRFDGRHLPYADNLVNLLVSYDLGDVSTDEVMRALAPRGVALLRIDGEWQKRTKPVPEAIDEWTHYLHGPDGNAVANDTLVGPPRHTQWIAEPKWQRHHELSPSVEAMVSAGGRVFAIVNEAPIGVDGLPDRWTLVARDAFNGKLLWKRPIDRWGWKYWSDHSHGNGRWNHPTHISRRVVAVGDRVYATLGFNAPLTALDAATGRTMTTYSGTELTDEVLYHHGTLVLAVNTAKQGPGHIKDKPAVKKEVVALEADTGKILWRSGPFDGAASKADAIERVTHLTMAIGGGRVVLVEENALTALDLATGKRVWRHARQADRQRLVTYGSYYFTNLCSLVVHDGIVYFTEPDPTIKRLPWNEPAESRLLAFSADSGELLWNRDCGVWGHYNAGDLFVIGGQLWIHDPKDFAMLALDLKTGVVQRTMSTEEALNQGHHHRCYRNKATPNFVITGRRGVEFIDLNSEDNTRHHWVRGTCRYGVLPANGLLYAPPHPCVCYITAKLNGFWALASARAETEEPTAEASLTLEKGPAYTVALSALDSPSHDWPTYRHDAARSGAASTTIPAELEAAWQVPRGGRLTSPVVANGCVYLASIDTHTVFALNADGGAPLWSYTTGGRIDTPPTIHRGLALVGSADGWVYCLTANAGQLVWRRRAAPFDKRMMNRDQLESPWPVHGSVLVQNDVAYYAAGRSSFLDSGIYVSAVDPATGELLAENRIFSPEAETGDMVECRLPYDMPPEALGALPDVMVGDGENVFMRHLKFSPDDMTYTSAAVALEKRERREHQAVGGHLMSVAGLLDDAWFNQTYWSVDGKSQSKMLVFNETTACGIKPFPGAARHSRAIFRPGNEGYTLFAADRPGHKKRWTKTIPVRAEAMLLADAKMLLAGAPDILPDDDPYAPFEGRAGGKLWVVSLADGTRSAEYDLASPPVYDGLAAARNRVYLSTQDGKVLCFQGR